MTTTYAVVDIETTGTNPKEDRIFQFGCVFVENGEIVGRFATDINPNRPISNQIQHLTHISNQQVKQAPYFEDVAETIYQLLADTVFVAHNIHFDYRFLNAELVRCGVPALNLPGIDTVELAQIFLPTEVSFRLSDLSESLGLDHEMPHQADSDAEVTAQLLLAIHQKMRHLPLVTLAQLSRLGDCLSMQTGAFITRVYQELAQSLPEPFAQLEIIEGLALRKKTVHYFTQPSFTPTYPKTKAAKEAFFQQKLEYRKAQQLLMNQVYAHFTSESEPKELILEAETGSGKTVGYLVPASFLATPETPLIISTASILLQNQLFYRDIPQLNALSELQLQAVILKSKRHYLDLQRFAQTLQHTNRPKQYVLYQMMVLVWLTETQSGDFDELNLLQLNHPFFEEVRHRGIDYLKATDAFYQVDFLRFLYAQKEQSNVLIINHAFLAHEETRATPLLPATNYLLIDEAHHLPENLEQVSTLRVDTGQFFHRIQRMLDHSWFKTWLSEAGSQGVLVPSVALYQQLLEQLMETLLAINEAFLADNVFISDEYILNQATREQFSLSKERMIQKLLQTFDDCQTVHMQMQAALTIDEARFTQVDKVQKEELIEFFSEVKRVADVLEQWFVKWELPMIHRLLTLKQARRLVYELIDFDAVRVKQTSWYKRFNRIIYLGATVTAAKDKKYLARKLGILDAKVKVMPATFDYQTQTNLFVLTQQQASEQEQTVKLSQAIRTILNSYDQSVLVLFTSHEQLQAVYQRLHFEFLQAGREILAQGIGGSRQKLLKRFAQSKSAVLFGADSFWEGVDLPGDQLQLLVVTKLPFENPQRPLVDAKYRYLTARGQNPFKQEALPKAMMKMRQGFGRLIRSPTDRGMMIVLDPRLVQSTYGKKMQQALPANLPIQTGNLTELKASLAKFFATEKNQNDSEQNSENLL